MDGQWGGYAELIVFIEIYNVQISIFDSIASERSLTRVTTTSGENSIFLLFSGVHYDSLIPKGQENIVELGDHVSNSKPKYLIHSDLKTSQIDEAFSNEYSTKYTEFTLKFILLYLRSKEYPNIIEDIRKWKNEIVEGPNNSNKQKEPQIINTKEQKEPLECICSLIKDSN